MKTQDICSLAEKLQSIFSDMIDRRLNQRVPLHYLPSIDRTIIDKEVMKIETALLETLGKSG